VRYNSTLATEVDVCDTVASLLGFAASSLPATWVVTGARYAAIGSNISLPVDLSISDLLGFAGTDTDPFPAVEHPRELVWVGRSQLTGRRARFSLYGSIIATPANYRLGPGETVWAGSTFIAALNAASAAGQFISIDGTPVQWYPYVNVNYNSYWETERRSNS
jgi:hypothetical protein